MEAFFPGPLTIILKKSDKKQIEPNIEICDKLFSSFENIYCNTKKNAPKILVINKKGNETSFAEKWENFIKDKNFGVLDENGNRCYESLKINHDQEDFNEIWKVLKYIAFNFYSQKNIPINRKVGCFGKIKNFCCPDKKKEEIIKES